MCRLTSQALILNKLMENHNKIKQKYRNYKWMLSEKFLGLGVYLEEYMILIK